MKKHILAIVTEAKEYFEVEANDVLGATAMVNCISRLMARELTMKACQVFCSDSSGSPGT